MLFKSKNFNGVVMNKYGVVLDGGKQQEPEIRDAVRSEAMAAGWRLVPSRDKDVGLVYAPPEAPDDGKGEQ